MKRPAAFEITRQPVPSTSERILLLRSCVRIGCPREVALIQQWGGPPDGAAASPPREERAVDSVLTVGLIRFRERQGVIFIEPSRVGPIAGESAD